MKNLLLTIALLMLFVPVKGQRNVIDSIYQLGKTEKNIKRKLLLFNETINQCWSHGEYEKAIRIGKESLKLAHKHKQDSIASLINNNIGIAYDYKGDYSQALTHFFTALSTAEKIKDRENQAYILSNIGLVYNVQNINDKALKYFHESLKIRRELNFKQGISASLTNIGIALMDLHQYEKAIQYYMEALIIDQELEDAISLGDDYNNLGVCFQEQNQYEKAEYYHLKALEIREKLGRTPAICNSKLNLGVIAVKQGKLKEGKKYLDESMDFFEKADQKVPLKFIYKSYSELGKEQGNYKLAFEYLEKLFVIKEELANEETIRNQAQQEMNYQLNKEREKQRIEKVKSDLENKKAQIILGAVTVVGITILIFSIVLYKRWKETKKQKVIIEEKNKQVEDKNHEILDSINYAKRIQTAILPSKQMRERILPEHFVLYEPKDIVAGDFYWIEETADSIIFAVADCTGHGVPGAMMSVVCHNALNRSVKEFGLRKPGEILDKTREIIVEELSKDHIDVVDGMDISLCALDKNTNQISWAGANNPLWIWKKESQEIVEIKPNKQPIGKHFDMKPFTTHLVHIEKGDRIYLITDGYADQFGGSESKKFKTKNLKKLLEQSSINSIKQQIDMLKSTFFNWKGNLDQVDDVCIMGIEFE